MLKKRVKLSRIRPFFQICPQCIGFFPGSCPIFASTCWKIKNKHQTNIKHNLLHKIVIQNINNTLYIYITLFRDSKSLINSFLIPVRPSPTVTMWACFSEGKRKHWRRCADVQNRLILGCGSEPGAKWEAMAVCHVAKQRILAGPWWTIQSNFLPFLPSWLWAWEDVVPFNFPSPGVPALCCLLFPLWAYHHRHVPTQRRWSCKVFMLTLYLV